MCLPVTWMTLHKQHLLFFCFFFFYVWIHGYRWLPPNCHWVEFILFVKLQDGLENVSRDSISTVLSINWMKFELSLEVKNISAQHLPPWFSTHIPTSAQFCPSSSLESFENFLRKGSFVGFRHGRKTLVCDTDKSQCFDARHVTLVCPGPVLERIRAWKSWFYSPNIAGNLTGMEHRLWQRVGARLVKGRQKRLDLK